MNICLYGAASDKIPQEYIEFVEKLGAEMAKRGHSLVYGGGAGGLMGAAARGVRSQKGEVIGIAPSFFDVDGILFEDCTELVYTDTMRERKALMEKRADAFVAVPGGIGTFDELFEIMSLRQLGRHTKPIAIFNANSYYSDIKNMMNKAVKEGFVSEECRKIAPFFEDLNELLDYLEKTASETEHQDFSRFGAGFAEDN